MSTQLLTQVFPSLATGLILRDKPFMPTAEKVLDLFIFGWMPPKTVFMWVGETTESTHEKPVMRLKFYNLDAPAQMFEVELYLNEKSLATTDWVREQTKFAAACQAEILPTFAICGRN